MVKLLFITPDYAKTIEYAARISTSTECRENSEEFVKKLVKKGHLSVGRHCNASFEIICSRACSHQLVRHTHLAYTQESQRYVTFDNEFIIPESIKNNKEAKLFFKNSLDHIKNSYEELLDMGIPKEDARYMLPNACLTRLVVSGNFQAWWDFVILRTDKSAQWEIREIAEEIKKILIKEAPAFFDFEKEKIMPEKDDIIVTA